ncbi:hypothetical protein MTO96_003361 [Rhipicephalus appendiculatus]
MRRISSPGRDSRMCVLPMKAGGGTALCPVDTDEDPGSQRTVPSSGDHVVMILRNRCLRVCSVKSRFDLRWSVGVCGFNPREVSVSRRCIPCANPGRLIPVRNARCGIHIIPNGSDSASCSQSTI